jgi:hypothetical protein
VVVLLGGWEGGVGRRAMEEMRREGKKRQEGEGRTTPISLNSISRCCSKYDRSPVKVGFVVRDVDIVTTQYGQIEA